MFLSRRYVRVCFLVLGGGVLAPVEAQFFQQGSKLIGTGSVGSSSQGYSVALSADGNTAVVGGANDNGSSGAAWVYTRTGGVWSQDGSKLAGTGSVGSSNQGSSVAISADGNTVIVGGPNDNSFTGAAWVYTRLSGGWTQQGSKLVGAGSVGNARQGYSVALSADGNTAIVGGPNDNGSAGAAWVYTRTAGIWSQQGSKLAGAGSVGSSSQGYSVALSADGNTAVVGGPDDNSSAGAAWVYTRAAGVWSQQGSKLAGAGSVGSSSQGYSVAVSGDGNTAIVGGLNDNSSTGAAWVYARAAGVWSQQGNKLVGTGGLGTANQGFSVAVSGDGNTAMTGGPTDVNFTGAAWVYTRLAGVWSQQGSKLVGTGAVGNARQGYSVAISADASTAIVGGISDNNFLGSAWVYLMSSNSPVTRFSITAPGSATAGTAFNYTVTALDGFGNTAGGYSGTVHFTSSDGAAALPADTFLISGVGTFSATLNTAGSRTITATDTVNPSVTGTSNAISVSGLAATHFSVTAPASSTAGAAFNYTVTALDAFGNTAAGYAGKVHFTSSDGAAVMPADSFLTNGVGTFSATLNTAGSRTITATDTVNPSVTGTSNPISVSGLAATHFSVTAPASSTAGVAFNYTVTALDAFGNTAAGYAGTVHFTSSDSAAVLPADSFLTNGVGTFSATLNTIGSRTITATDTVNPSVTGTSNPISVSGPAATHFSVTAPASSTAGVAFNYTVTAQDAFGNTAAGYAGTVHFTSSDSAAALPADSFLTNGVGTFSTTLKTAGNRTITATDKVVASITGTASMQVGANSAASITVVGGSPQSADVGTAFATALQAAAADAFGNPVSGATVTFTAPGSGASAVLSSGTPATNSSGVASTTATANTTAGSYTVTASIPGHSATFSLTNVAGTDAASVTVQTSPPGLRIEVDGTPYASPKNFSFLPGSAHTIAVQSLQAGAAGTQYRFANWSDGGAASHSMTVSGSATYTATFTTQYQLTTMALPANGGSVTPASGVFYNEGTVVPLTAAANSGYRFVNWVGGVASTNSPATTITMNGPQSAAASFASPTNTGVAPSTLVLDYYLGTDPKAAAAGTVSVTSDSSFIVVPEAAWIAVSPLSGLPSATVTVQPKPEGLSAGNYFTSLTFAFADGSTAVVAVVLRVWGLPQLALTVATQAPLDFTAQAGSTATLSRDITVAAYVRNVPVQVSGSVASGGNWLSVSPSSGTTSLPVHVQVNPAGLAAGVYLGTVTLTSADAQNSPFTLPVTLTVAAAPPAISIAEIDNAASMTRGPGAPDTILTAFGTFPGCSSGAQVLIDESPANVFYSSSKQVNFLAPASMAGKPLASLKISCGGLVSESMALPIANNAPGIFTMAQNGTGQAAIVNQDGSVGTVSEAGSYVQVYVTGFPLLGAPRDGLVRVELPVTVTVGGMPATVQYAGEVPGYTPGLQQINVLIPANAPTGPAVPLQISMGSANTQAGVTLAIR